MQTNVILYCEQKIEVYAYNMQLHTNTFSHYISCVMW